MSRIGHGLVCHYTTSTCLPIIVPLSCFRCMASQVKFGRFGKPEEVANVAIFLASDEASNVQGQEYAVDGGMTV